MAFRKEKGGGKKTQEKKALDKFELLKNAFYYLVVARRWFREAVYLFRKEIEEKKRLLIRSVIFLAFGAGLLITGVFFGGMSLFFLLQKYFHDPLLSASAIAGGFFFIALLSLFLGARSIRKLFSLDYDRMKRSFLD